MNEQTKINPDNVLKKLATGISLLEIPVREIPPILDLGLRELQALYICNLGRSLPPSRFDIFELFEQPLKKWWPSELSVSECKESLMFLGQPTSFCMDWALERDHLSAQLSEIDEVLNRQICGIVPNQSCFLPADLCCHAQVYY